jgi:hypothetical protein
MKGNRKHLTRKNYFMILQERGYEYDYSQTRKKQDEYVNKNLRIDEVIAIPDELDWEKSEKLHSDFDKLSRSNAGNRKPEDIICNSVFDKLLDELHRCEKLRHHVDRFIAHSLKPEKVEKLDDEALRITFEHLWKAQEIICKVTHFVGKYLLGIADYGLLPIPHGSFLQYIEEPLITKEEKSKLRKEEDNFQNDIRSWKIKIADLCV